MGTCGPNHRGKGSLKTSAEDVKIQTFKKETTREALG